uniref:Uncharacterized protein n=1 Tax=Anguilla anguilla TaxID=7936 RepID=A0A0E9VYG4_ANGAN
MRELWVEAEPSFDMPKNNNVKLFWRGPQKRALLYTLYKIKSYN